ncbi:phenylacetate--CoA ligase family protein [Clostridium perfringens]
MDIITGDYKGEKMNKILKEIYINSPFWMKRIFANMEAIRRDRYRRYGDYDILMNEIRKCDLFDVNDEKQLERINSLLEYVVNNIEFFNEKKEYYKALSDISLLEKIPLLNKNIMREDIKKFIKTDEIKHFFKSTTSGSTGTPFVYYRDKSSVRYSFAVHDRIYELISNGEDLTKVRISGVRIVNTNKKKGPFWYFIDKYKQLQCSAYHINKNTCLEYIEAFKKYKVEIGTGYASSWLHLAEYLRDYDDIEIPKLRAIITDSEGLTNDQKKIIEDVFNCKVYVTYGLSEVGNVALQCKNNNYHIIKQSCIVEVVDVNGKSVEDGELGEIVVTDLNSFKAPFIRYATGDMAIIKHKECGCGWNGIYFSELVGRVEDYIVTSDNRKVKRLGHIAKPAKGIIGMQLVQERIGELLIRVLPGENFEENSMNDVIKLCHEYIGEISVRWEKVDKLEQTKAGKIKYIIRKF